MFVPSTTHRYTDIASVGNVSSLHDISVHWYCFCWSCSFHPRQLGSLVLLLLVMFVPSTTTRFTGIASVGHVSSLHDNSVHWHCFCWSCSFPPRHIGSLILLLLVMFVPSATTRFTGIAYVGHVSSLHDNSVHWYCFCWSCSSPPRQLGSLLLLLLVMFVPSTTHRFTGIAYVGHVRSLHDNSVHWYCFCWSCSFPPRHIGSLVLLLLVMFVPSTTTRFTGIASVGHVRSLHDNSVH